MRYTSQVLFFSGVHNNLIDAVKTNKDEWEFDIWTLVASIIFYESDGVAFWSSAFI